MAVPAFIRHARIIVTLVAKLSLIFVTVHAGAIETHHVLFLIIGNVRLPGLANHRVSPIFQQGLVIDTNDFLGFDTFLFVSRELWFGDVIQFSARHIVPERISD